MIVRTYALTQADRIASRIADDIHLGSIGGEYEVEWQPTDDRDGSPVLASPFYLKSTEDDRRYRIIVEEVVE